MDGVRIIAHPSSIVDEAAATDGRLLVFPQVYRRAALRLAKEKGVERDALAPQNEEQCQMGVI
jgi:hypothetical protein